MLDEMKQRNALEFAYFRKTTWVFVFKNAADFEA